MNKKNWKRTILVGALGLSLTFQASFATAAFKPGEVKPYAGSGELGYEDGKSEFAKFNLPTAAVEGEAQSIFIADTENHRIRLVTPSKEVTTFAGTTTETDQYGFVVGGHQDGQATNAMFNGPRGIAVDDEGTVYVADTGNNAIRTISTNGTVSTLTTDLNGPSDVVINNAGELIVSDTLNHRIVKVNNQGELTVIAGGSYSSDDNGLVGSFADGNGVAAKFNEPSGLALDAAGNVYVADTGNQRIRKIDNAGTVSTFAGTGSVKIEGTSYIQGGFVNGDKARAQFNFPTGLAFDQEGNLFIADSLNHVVRVVTATGNVETVAGIVGESGNRRGTESKAKFDSPFDVTVLQNGKLIVVGQLNNRVRELSWYQLPASVKSDGTAIDVVFKNAPINFTDAKPKVVDGRTLIPLRAVTEAFGYKVDWNAETQEIAISNDDLTVQLTVGDLNVKTPLGEFPIDVAPELEQETNRTYVPLRFVAEAFNYQVDWLAEERVVLIR